MARALDTTYYCDHDHEAIQSAAAVLKDDDQAPEAIARKTFYFVRDRFPFGFDLYQRKASDILKQGYGVCWHKALLLVALLRSNGIPAQFGSIPMKRTFVKPVIGAWSLTANQPFHHCIAKAHIDGRWILLDAVLDRKSYEAFFVPAGVGWDIEWDGKNDVHLYTESVLGAPVLHTDIDGAINNNVDNKELPKRLALLIYRHLNQKMWRKAGIEGPAMRSASRTT